MLLLSNQTDLICSDTDSSARGLPLAGVLEVGMQLRNYLFCILLHSTPLSSGRSQVLQPSGLFSDFSSPDMY
jgi:hypothetical protein